jgi:glycosyltransferase involved in cell wall biosynthesis
VPATLVPDLLGRVPSVVSLDATPRQYDELGAFYGHHTGNRYVEAAKRSVHRLCLDRATRLVAWSMWTKAGLVEDYDVPEDKIAVIPPGVDTDLWASIGSRRAEGHGDVTRVLFVGGDLERKGGKVLLDAVSRLRTRGVGIELDLVTRDAIDTPAGIRVHHGLQPNHPDLIALYQGADVFCLPTFGDCLPMVLSEAGAVGLPVVATSVGAIGEIVRDNETGLLVPAGDVEALINALERLVGDRDLRHRLGCAARETVLAEFDAARNAARLASLLRETAGFDVDVGDQHQTT